MLLASEADIGGLLTKALLWGLAGVAIAVVALLIIATLVGFALTGLVHSIRRRFGWSEDEFYDDEFEE